MYVERTVIFCTSPLKFSWRHHGSRDNALKWQFSKGNNNKSAWSIDFNFRKRCIQKLPSCDCDVISWIFMTSWFFWKSPFIWAYLANAATFFHFFLLYLLGQEFSTTRWSQNDVTSSWRHQIARLCNTYKPMVNPRETWWTDRCWARDRKSEVWC